MITYLHRFFQAMRPAFSREKTFQWFMVVFVGFVLRTDTLGVSSVMRALFLAASGYPCLLHFFHSTAWEADRLMQCWRRWVLREGVAQRVNGRLVVFGDHTNVPRDGQRMPHVTTLHQTSETSSKPSFFRGHCWAFVALLVKVGNTRFKSIGLWAEIHHNSLPASKATRIVNETGRIVQEMGEQAYLVLDAYFAGGPVFEKAKQYGSSVCILVRGKKSFAGYLAPPPRAENPGPGRPPIYGEKVKLQEVFDTRGEEFKTVKATVYKKLEQVRYLTLDLLWKPLKEKVRFILIESSRGQIILMTDDLTMQPLTALFLYCHRVTIESLFDRLKNLLGGMCYHFWSRYLQPTSRRPVRNKKTKASSSQPEKTSNTVAAIEKFVSVSLVVLGVLQLLACLRGSDVKRNARACWLRTPCGNVPSLFVTKFALANVLLGNLRSFSADAITRLIRSKQDHRHENCDHDRIFKQAA